jgi:hypothetical protein
VPSSSYLSLMIYVQETVHLKHLLVEDKGDKANLVADKVPRSMTTGMAVGGNGALSPESRAIRPLV